MTAPDHDAARRFATLSIEQQAILLGRSPLDWAGDLAERLGRLDASRDQLAEARAEGERLKEAHENSKIAYGRLKEERDRLRIKVNEAVGLEAARAVRDEANKAIADALATVTPAYHQALLDLKAAANGLPVLLCPKCEHPQVDYDGFGVLACTRDPQCYCTHPGSTDGVCDICGQPDEADDG